MSSEQITAGDDATAAEGVDAALTAGEQEEVHEESIRAPRTFSLKHVGIMLGSALLLGGLLGFWGGYSQFAESVQRLTAERDKLQTTLAKLKKEHANMQAETETARANLVESQRLLKDSQRALTQAIAANRSQAQANGQERRLEGLSSMPYNRNRVAERPQQPARSAPSGLCDVSASNPAEGLARCIENFNQGDR